MTKLNFGANGLIPAIVQDSKTGKVLMMAYMSGESYEISLREGYTCFFSRSRNTLWRKGETSGNRQKIVSVQTDCDADTLLVRVEPEGPACHTGEMSCFHNDILGESGDFSLEGLYSIIMDRKTNPKEGSYTTYLFEKGREKILKKIGEESTETVIGALKNSREETVFEVADLAYHVLVLLAEMGITVEEVKKELASRHVVDKKTKQETMR